MAEEAKQGVVDICRHPWGTEELREALEDAVRRARVGRRTLIVRESDGLAAIVPIDDVSTLKALEEFDEERECIRRERLQDTVRELARVAAKGAHAPVPR